jgi:hypothetical protein
MQRYYASARGWQSKHVGECFPTVKLYRNPLQTGVKAMTNQLVYGKENQIRFDNMSEKQEAFAYFQDNVNKWYVEPNDISGAYAEEYRIYINSSAPECLKRQRTNGNRINCKELYDEIVQLYA